MNTDKPSAATPSTSLEASSGRTVVFDGGTPDGSDGLFANANFSWVAAASSFTLDAAIRFNGMAWWGGYAYAGVPDAEDDFTLDIMALEEGQPGRLIHTVRLGNCGRAATGGTIGSLGLPEYRYQAQFDEIGLEPGSYWACLSNRYAGMGNWFWETTSGGQRLHRCAAFNLEEDCWEIAELWRRTYDLAFQFTLSRQLGEHSRLALLGLALAGLAASREARRGLSWLRFW